MIKLVFQSGTKTDVTGSTLQIKTLPVRNPNGTISQKQCLCSFTVHNGNKLMNVHNLFNMTGVEVNDKYIAFNAGCEPGTKDWTDSIVKTLGSALKLEKEFVVDTSGSKTNVTEKDVVDNAGQPSTPKTIKITFTQSAIQDNQTIEVPDGTTFEEMFKLVDEKLYTQMTVADGYQFLGWMGVVNGKDKIINPKNNNKIPHDITLRGNWKQLPSKDDE